MFDGDANDIMHIKDVIFCDDVRREDNGKFIIIGVYTGGIVVNSFPHHMGISVFAHLDQKEVGSVPIELRLVLGPDEIELLRFSGRTEIREPDPWGTLILGPVPVQLQRSGYIAVQFSQNGAPMREVGRMKVLTRPPANATIASQPLS